MWAGSGKGNLEERTLRKNTMLCDHKIGYLLYLPQPKRRI
jgi:hypothetical protein